ncbi:MAG: tRNA (adenosine(37)-N6)-threonylcarbamoyltransferase complex dimerization subunit type 1 TsaB [Clostridia bacterium]|nr:tRNA (adenosine(37)-N6)-threonylcarbamoyltransferase complex dimerization subunit type 1 TsaB [Clostridia bacterium]
MILLSVDASAKSAAVAVTDGEILLAEGFENSGFTHSETLLPLVDATLKKAGKSIDEIDAFAVTNGPGSFTGLRIGCALVKGLAGDKPCYPVPTLSALAYNCIDCEGVVIPMMDARRQQTYTATFAVQEGKISQITEDRAIAVEQLENEILSYLDQGKKVYVPGDGAYLLSEDVAQQVQKPAHPLILGISVAKATQNIDPVSAVELGLRYLRLSQAERERNIKLGGKEQ